MRLLADEARTTAQKIAKEKKAEADEILFQEAKSDVIACILQAAKDGNYKLEYQFAAEVANNLEVRTALKRFFVEEGFLVNYKGEDCDDRDVDYETIEISWEHQD